MIRFAAILTTILVAIITAPYAQTPGFNSADAIVTLAPFTIVFIVAIPAPRAPRRPVSNWLVEDIPADHPDTLGSLDRQSEAHGRSVR